MKKTLFFAVAMLSVGSMLQAQSRLTTRSVYDVDGENGVSVSDATQVISRVIGTVKEDPQVAEVSQLNLLLESIDNKLQKIQDKMFGKYDEKNIKANGHDYVDMGLVDENGRPVYWATCNLGATNEEQFGNYYAWGSIYGYATIEDYLAEGVTLTPDQLYTWDDYCYGTAEDNLTKYNDSDYKIVLDPEDDAAAKLWGGSWRMPTEDEFRLLLNNCTWEWTFRGCRVTSNINGNSIFLPACGEYDMGSPKNDDSYGYYWSTSLSDPMTHGSCLFFEEYNTSAIIGNLYRCAGATIRPVCSPVE